MYGTTTHTAYRQIRSIFGIASIPNTDFGSITPNKFSNCSNWVESVWKHNTQHVAKLGQYLGLMENPKNWNNMG